VDGKIKGPPFTCPTIFSGAVPSLLLFFFSKQFYAFPARNTLRPSPPPQWTLQVRSPHLARSVSGPDHCAKPQKNPDGEKPNRTEKGINRRDLLTPLCPPPELPLPGRFPKNAVPHSLPRAGLSLALGQTLWACAVGSSRLPGASHMGRRNQQNTRWAGPGRRGVIWWAGQGLVGGARGRGAALGGAPALNT
jgi:hypothetical protein